VAATEVSARRPDGLEDDEIVRRARARVGQMVKERWHLDALLGVGGSAAVYAATHRNGSRVAVKWLHPELSTHAATRERFVREGYIANQIGHPGVVEVIDDDVSDDGSLVLFMELLRGETLDARWRRAGKRLPVAETLRVAHALLEVVVAAHAAGVVHRDLKPENVFLTETGTLKVLDFGIARLHQLSARSDVTGSQSSFGTPSFMSPEQARGRWDEVDARSDVWAVGATLFTLLTGRHVHEAETVNEQLLAAMTQPAPPVVTFAPELPPAVALLVDRALAFKADQRWPDARSMLAACLAAETGAPALLPVPPRQETTVPLPPRVVPVVTQQPSSKRLPRAALAIAGGFIAIALVAGGRSLLRLRTTPAVAVGSSEVAEPSHAPVPSASVDETAPPPPSSEPSATTSAPPRDAPPPPGRDHNVARQTKPAESKSSAPAPVDWHDRRR
jgi:serine/threonine-protein kinase